MAPTTRLRDHTIEQLSYANTGRTRGQPNLSHNETDPMRQTRKQPERAARSASEEKTASRAAGSGIIKQGAVDATQNVAVSKGKKRADKRECFICAESKTSRGYQTPKEGEVCEHFLGICRACVQKLVKSKIIDDDLSESSLRCPFGDCGHEVAYLIVEEMVTVGTFKSWDQGLLRRHLRDTQDIIPCLNPKCGLRFSVENCNVDSAQGQQKLTCPYCDYDFCACCSRAWHPEATCNQNWVNSRAEEDKQSQETIKEMGTQPCPHCGIKIEKDGGCDHKYCTACKREFHWNYDKRTTVQDTTRVQ